MKLLVALCVVSSLGVCLGQSCRRTMSGWYSSSVYLYPRTVNGRRITYFGCKIFRPRSSACNGGCSSSNTFVISPKFSFSSKCECCKATRIQSVKPKARCQAILTGGCPPLISHNVVESNHPTLNNYRYYVLDNCRCSACRGSGFGRRKRNVAALTRAGLPADLSGSVTQVDQSSVPELPVPEETVPTSLHARPSASLTPTSRYVPLGGASLTPTSRYVPQGGASLTPTSRYVPQGGASLTPTANREVDAASTSYRRLVDACRITPVPTPRRPLDPFDPRYPDRFLEPYPHRSVY